MSTSFLRVVDKMPENYLHLGLISILFPQAKIIHTIRNPLDTCLSCYFQSFTSVPWSYDLKWIAARFLQYQKIIEFWKSVIPANNIIDIEYERLVSDPDKYSRQIIDHLGLEWDPACLDFHKQQDVIHTANVWQVRQPVYKSSVKRWENYLSHVGELAPLLSSVIDDKDRQVLNKANIKLRQKKWWHISGA